MQHTVLDTGTAPHTRSPARSRNRGLLALALPSVAWYLIFTIGPLGAMFVVAFMDWEGLAAPATFNGLHNFRKLADDPQIITALRNTGVHLFGSLPIMMVASFMLGYFLSLKLPGHRVLRVIMFIPALISLSSLGMLFIAVLGPTGLVNSVLDEVGSHSLTTAWLADPQTAMAALIGITIWSGTGFNAILFAARLSSIDAEIYSAAEIDGATHWQKMWRVAFPIALDFFGVLTMLQYLWTLFGSAGLILLLTRGGPGEATSTLSWLVYRFGFRQPDIGYSQAIGLLLFVLGVIGLVVIRRVFRARY
jgi:ABC-type sugar transport system permease subunit